MNATEDPRFAKLTDHGDAIVAVCCKMGLGENEEIVVARPAGSSL